MAILQAIKKRGHLTAEDDFGGYRDTPEWEDLRMWKLIYHHNREYNGEYISYSMTKLGELAFSQAV